MISLREVDMNTAEVEVPGVPARAGVFHHIIAATDFSEPSERALYEALALAEESGADLSVVHVMRTDWRYEVLENPCEVGLEEKDARKRLEFFIKKLAPAQKLASTLVNCGPVARSLASEAAKQGADLLVIGTRGRGGISKLALGSVSEELLRIAPCAVMTIGPSAELLPGGAGAIVFATDFGEGSVQALKVAVGLANTRRSKLILLHITPPMPVNSTSLSAYAPAAAASEEVIEWKASSRLHYLQRLKACLPSGIKLEREPEYMVGTELLPEAVLTAAHRFKAGLIVMGANQVGSAKVLAHIPWTAIHEVLRDAPCPMLTVAG